MFPDLVIVHQATDRGCSGRKPVARDGRLQSARGQSAPDSTVLPRPPGSALTEVGAPWVLLAAAESNLESNLELLTTDCGPRIAATPG